MELVGEYVMEGKKQPKIVKELGMGTEKQFLGTLNKMLGENNIDLTQEQINRFTGLRNAELKAQQEGYRRGFEYRSYLRSQTNQPILNEFQFWDGDKKVGNGFYNEKTSQDFHDPDVVFRLFKD